MFPRIYVVYHVVVISLLVYSIIIIIIIIFIQGAHFTKSDIQ